MAAPCNEARASLVKYPLVNAVAIRDGDVLLFVCLSVRSFVCLSPVKFVKSFGRWQHLAASAALSYRVRYTHYIQGVSKKVTLLKLLGIFSLGKWH